MWAIVGPIIGWILGMLIFAWIVDTVAGSFVRETDCEPIARDCDHARV